MKVTRQLHDLDQSLSLDNIIRDLLSSRRLEHCIDELSRHIQQLAIRIEE